uniref:Uncharacterized protein n=1 Tax=Anguilla anguilla TaxID=7936 RepID=A0A0E9UZY3_ANGAN
MHDTNQFVFKQLGVRCSCSETLRRAPGNPPTARQPLLPPELCRRYTSSQ